MNPPTPPQSAFDKIESLIRKFKDLPARTRQQYNEDNTRKDFVLPFFRALEWNIDDMREVAAEEKISRGFVDFSFRINGIRRFVLETKRIGEDLNKPEWAQQAIDYAYHKGVTWAVLSDFEGLKIFNAEARAVNPFQAQFKEFTVEEYLPRLGEVWWLSRSAMLENVLDREAEKVFKKIPKTPIAQGLFDNLRDWREKLYKLLREYNRGKLYDAKQIDDAVQHILDRLIFIRTAEDREVEGEKLIALVRELKDRNRFDDLIPELNRRFRDLDRVYNSQLFAPHYSEDLDLGEPSTLADIINGLYGSPADFTNYNFALIDADVLGRVYEQYLGYVLSEREELEAKKTKRKSQGIYYTPTFVVKYIVQQTLGHYLEEHGYNPAHPVRVLDPACGSGSFLIEAFDVLDQYLARERKQERGEYDIQDHARQMQILTENIYGVDKDEQAVEVAQLNLLLKALHVRDRLPKLENIRQGDSLISGAPQQLEKFFGAKWKAKKPFNWDEQFKKVMADGGFDVIVGNPPYVQMSMDAKLRETLGQYLIERFGSSMGRLNTFGFFIHLGINLLRPGGRLGFIVPNTILTMPYYSDLRKYMLDHCAIEAIGTFQEGPFAEAVVENVVLILRREDDLQARRVNTVLIEDVSAPYQIQKPTSGIHQSEYQDAPGFVFGIRVEEQSQNIKARLLAQEQQPLGTLVNINQAIALKGDRSASLFNRARGKDYKRVLDGRDIGRYSIYWPGTYLKYDLERIHSCKREDIFLAGEKLFFRRVGEGIVATLDSEQFYALNTLVVITPKVSTVNLKFILGVINSHLMNYYFTAFLKSTKKVFSEIQARQMSQLPIRRINFDDATEKKQHDRIVALVKEMLELQKDYASATREKLPRADALKRRIDEVDAEIDGIVYHLYGLTDEEIRIVQGD